MTQTSPVTPASPSAPAPSIAWLPGRGVLSGGLTAVVSWLIIAIANHYGLNIPVEIQAMIPAALGYIVTYLLPPTAKDVANRLNDQIVALAAADPSNPVSERTMVLPPDTKVVASTAAAPIVATPPAMGPPPVVKDESAQIAAEQAKKGA